MDYKALLKSRNFTEKNKFNHRHKEFMAIAYVWQNLNGSKWVKDTINVFVFSQPINVSELIQWFAKFKIK